jgi:hypothetical protein
MERSIETKGMGGSPEVTEDEDLREAVVGDDLVFGVDRDEVRPPPGVVVEEDVALRSDLAVHLRPAAFPADKEAMAAEAQAQGAPDELLDVIAKLPDGVWFGSVQEAWVALGGPVEHRGVAPSEAAVEAGPEEAPERWVPIEASDLHAYPERPGGGEEGTSEPEEVEPYGARDVAAGAPAGPGQPSCSPAALVAQAGSAFVWAGELAVHVPLEIARAAGGFLAGAIRRFTHPG